MNEEQLQQFLSTLSPEQRIAYDAIHETGGSESDGFDFQSAVDLANQVGPLAGKLGGTPDAANTLTQDPNQLTANLIDNSAKPMQDQLKDFSDIANIGDVAQAGDIAGTSAAATGAAPGLGGIGAGIDIIKDKTANDGDNTNLSFGEGEIQDVADPLDFGKNAVGSGLKAVKATGNPYAAIPAVLFELAATGIERKSAIRKNKILEGQQEFAWEQQQKYNNSYLDPNSVYFQGDKGYMGGTVVT